MNNTYTQAELDDLLFNVVPRRGWDFSSMNTQRQNVPWDYVDEVKKHLRPSDEALDIGTGGGERFMQLAPYFKQGVGTDIDPEMVAIATQNAKDITNLTYLVMNEKLEELDCQFDIIINRHAPIDLGAIKNHLKPGGYFITQQVGEKNMQNVKLALGRSAEKPPVTIAEVKNSGFDCVEYREYNVEYVVHDIASLVFWLNALDMLHADLAGEDALKSADTLNNILSNNVDNRGFVTNEQRYLVVAKYVQ